MDKIKLQPTELAEWYTLIREAENASAISLDEAMENYLVMLLMRFVKDSALAESILAMEFLEAQEKLSIQQRNDLQTVGDKCLLFSGLFPSNAERRRVKISYFIELGRSAYHQVSEMVPSQMQSLYLELCHTFVKMRDVLQATRELDQQASPTMSQLAALELWHDTGSAQAYKVLGKYSDSIPIILPLKHAQ